jgi:starvation-inducible DNA-binding protein
MALANKHSRDTKTLVRDISHENAADSPVVEALRRQTANGLVLYLNYKHYHWQTFGPLFRDLHKLFDRFAQDVLETVDPLAERIRMIGQDPPSGPVEIADIATVAVAAPHSTMREMVEEANRNTLVVIKEIRQAVKTAEEHDDPGTVDLFSKLVQIHEKHEWWLRDMLQGGDGFSGAER